MGAKPKFSLAQRRQLVRKFFDGIAHNRALGIVCEALFPGRATMRLPFQKALLGDAENGFLHGGAVSALTDACAGAAVFMALREITPIATLDLRIDYLRAAVSPHDVIAETHCYRVTRHVAFVRGTAKQSDGALVAEVTATFAVGTSQ